MRAARLGSILLLLGLVLSVAGRVVASGSAPPDPPETDADSRPASIPTLAANPAPPGSVADATTTEDSPVSEVVSAPWTLDVSVVDPEGRPACGADVCVVDRSNALIRRDRSDTGGHALFAGLTIEDLKVRAFVDGCLGAEEYAFRPLSGNRREVLVTLQRGIPCGVRVVDAATGGPIPGARVRVVRVRCGDPVDRTDVFGRVHVTGVPPIGDTLVWADAAGYLGDSAYVRVADGEARPRELVIRLQPAACASGLVLTPDGEPVADAWVWATPLSEFEDSRRRAAELDALDPDTILSRLEQAAEVWRRSAGVSREPCATSDARGAFRVDGLGFGKPYVLRAGGAKCAPSEAVPILVEPGSPSDATTLRLRRAATLTVRVRTPEDAPPPDAASLVLIGPESEGRCPTVWGRERAPWRFENLEPGVYHALANCHGLLRAAARIRVEEGRTVETEVTLGVGEPVEGVVLGPDGMPVAEADVVVAPAAMNRDYDPQRDRLVGAAGAETDAGGRFRITGLPRGPLVLEATRYRSPHDLWNRGLTHLAAPASGLCIRLSTVGQVRARVLLPDGRPCAQEAGLRVREQGGNGFYGCRDWPIEGVVPNDWLEDGKHTASIDVEGFALVVREVEIHGGNTVDLGDVVLEPGVDVRGLVTDDAGRPIPWADVDVVAAHDRDTRADADGAYVLHHAPRGPLALRVSAEGYVPREVLVDGSRDEVFVTRLSRAVE